MGVPFYIDERSIVPRSFIAELLADGSIDGWLSDKTVQVLDLCTGNGLWPVWPPCRQPDGASHRWPIIHQTLAGPHQWRSTSCKAA